MIICRICKEEINEDDWNTRYSLNPLTFRWAMMHNFCLRNAYEDLKGQVIEGPYKDKQDKYNCVCAGSE